MDLNYFRMINNSYKSKSKQETDLHLVNRHIDDHFADTIDYAKVLRNGKPYELIIIKDTDGNTMHKKIKSRHDDPFNLGDYIEWNDQIWLVTLLDPNDKVHHSGYMYLCQYPIRWQNSKGEIIQRYAYIEDFMKYSSGVTGNYTLTFGDNQYGIKMPLDEETKQLKRDMRFVIDFDGVEEPDCYKLTNRKSALDDYTYFNRGAVITFTMTVTAFNRDTDKLVQIDNDRKVWICDYQEHIAEIEQPKYFEGKNPDFGVEINGGSKIRIGKQRKWTFTIRDSKGNEIPNFGLTWKIVGNVNYTAIINDDVIQLLVTDDNEVGNTFTIQVLYEDIVMTQAAVEVAEIY